MSNDKISQRMIRPRTSMSKNVLSQRLVTNQARLRNNITQDNVHSNPRILSNINKPSLAKNLSSLHNNKL